MTTTNPNDICAECGQKFVEHKATCFSHHYECWYYDDKHILRCCTHFTPKQYDLGKSVDIKASHVASWQKQHPTPPKTSEDEVEKPWSHQIMVEINKLTPDIKGKAFDIGWFLLRQMLEQKDEQTTQLRAEVESLKLDKEILGGKVTKERQYQQQLQSFLDEVKKENDKDTITIKLFEQTLTRVEKERDAYALSLAQKHEALEGMSELCGNYFDETQLVCARDREIWAQHLEALSTPTSATTTAMLKQFEDMKHALRRIASNDGRGSIHPSECDLLRVIATEALNPTKD